MSQVWQVRLFYALTAVALVSFGLGLWNMAVSPEVGPMYNVAIYIVTQGILMIWCLRDLYKRKFSNDTTKLNWFAAILFLGVVGTTAYLVRVKRHQWLPGR